MSDYRILHMRTRKLTDKQCRAIAHSTAAALIDQHNAANGGASFTDDELPADTRRIEKFPDEIAQSHFNRGPA